MEVPSPSRSETLKLELPVDLKYITSYMTWMEELACHVEKSAVTKASSLTDYIKLILAAKNKAAVDPSTGVVLVVPINPESTYQDDEESDWADNIGHCAIKLNIAAMFTYLGDLDSARTYLGELSDEFLDGLNLTENHRKVIVYFRDTLEWVIGYLPNKHKEGALQGFTKHEIMWEDFKDGSDQLQAALAFLKACLSSEMKCSEEVTLNLLREATALDPECHIWYHYQYRVVRRIRRNLRRGRGSRLPPPSKEERRLAEKGFELSPTDVVSITDYALVLKETLWMEAMPEWDANEETYIECAELFENAYRIASKMDNKKWMKKVKVYLAEFLVFGKGNKLDQDHGKIMFDELAVEYPQSSFVLHKVAKLYHHGLWRQGVAQDRKYVDLDRAKELYKQALDCHPSNFACLMDYIKLLHRMKDFGTMSRAIDKTLHHATRDYQVAKLMVLKGYLVWIHNPQASEDNKKVAVETWLRVVKTLPGLANDVYRCNDVVFFDKNHLPNDVRKEIVEYLETVMYNCEDEAEAAELESFTMGMKKSLIPRKTNGNARFDRKKDDLVDKMKDLTVAGNSDGDEQERKGKQTDRSWRSGKRAPNKNDRKDEE